MDFITSVAEMIPTGLKSSITYKWWIWFSTISLITSIKVVFSVQQIGLREAGLCFSRKSPTGNKKEGNCSLYNDLKSLALRLPASLPAESTIPTPLTDLSTITSRAARTQSWILTETTVLLESPKSFTLLFPTCLSSPSTRWVSNI